MRSTRAGARENISLSYVRCTHTLYIHTRTHPHRPRQTTARKIKYIVIVLRGSLLRPSKLCAEKRVREPADWGIYIRTICMHKVSEYVYNIVCIATFCIFQACTWRLLIHDAIRAADGKLYKESYLMDVPRNHNLLHSCAIHLHYSAVVLVHLAPNSA